VPRKKQTGAAGQPAARKWCSSQQQHEPPTGVHGIKADTSGAAVDAVALNVAHEDDLQPRSRTRGQACSRMGRTVWER
jgi:hypothetical protein